MHVSFFFFFFFFVTVTTNETTVRSTMEYTVLQQRKKALRDAFFGISEEMSSEVDSWMSRKPKWVLSLSFLWRRGNVEAKRWITDRYGENFRRKWFGSVCRRKYQRNDTSRGRAWEKRFLVRANMSMGTWRHICMVVAGYQIFDERDSRSTHVWNVNDAINGGTFRGI